MLYQFAQGKSDLPQQQHQEVEVDPNLLVFVPPAAVVVVAVVTMYYLIVD